MFMVNGICSLTGRRVDRVRGRVRASLSGFSTNKVKFGVSVASRGALRLVFAHRCESKRVS